MRIDAAGIVSLGAAKDPLHDASSEIAIRDAVSAAATTGSHAGLAEASSFSTARYREIRARLP